MKETKMIKLSDLDIIFATREIARFVIKKTLEKKYHIISFQNIKSVSRSFLDELYLLSQKNNISLENIADEIEPLYKIITRSHNNQKMYAPNIKVRISNTVFA